MCWIEVYLVLRKLRANFNCELSTYFSPFDTSANVKYENCFRYFQHIHPWMALLSLETDTQPLAVRERSPILFHSILILTTYYRPRTSSNILLYRAISSILDSILSPIILCPQPDQLNADRQSSLSPRIHNSLFLINPLFPPPSYSSLINSCESTIPSSII